MQTFLNWMLYNGSYFLSISAAVALFRFRYLTGALRYVGLFVALACLGEIVAEITAAQDIRNLYILHGYTILEFNLIALFYHLLFGSFYPRGLVPALMAVFTVAALLNSMLWQPVSGYNTNARGLEAILIIGLAVLCFYKMLTELAIKRIDHHSVFWINVGFLVYFAGGLFFLFLGNAAMKQSDRSLVLAVFGLHALLMVLMHLLISIGLWVSPRFQQTSTP